MKSKRGFEFSFAWIFAIFVGAIIVFIAIYAASRFIATGTYQIETVTAKELSIIFEPLETGLAAGKSSIVNLREDTRIYNKCYDTGSFGRHRISLSTRGIGTTWKKPGGDILIPNKYLFSDDVEEGRTIYFFSKPFEMPFKVSEIIFLTTKSYCFLNAPEEIEDEVTGLILQNIKLDNCSDLDVRVCFGGGEGCDIQVTGICFGDCESSYDYGFVEKDGESLFYEGSLIYAAIFSSKEIYECNVKRLMKRLVQQALLFEDEAFFLAGKCGSLPSAGLIQLVSIARALENSKDLVLVRDIAKEVEEQNDAAQCSLW